MNADLILYWMSHLGEGSWSRLVEAIKELAGDEDQDRVRRKLRVSLSDSGHVDFLPDSRRWRVRRPVLAGLMAKEDTTMLCGGRTPALIESLRQAAKKTGCAIFEETIPDRPSHILIRGTRQALLEVESLTGIQFIPDYSFHALASAVPVSKTYQEAVQEKGTLNWCVSVFEFDSLRWVRFSERLSSQDTLPCLAPLEFKSDYETKYCVTDKQGIPRRLSRREAVYAAASLRRRPLIQYASQQRLLSTPLQAPLPEPYTRAFCLSSGESAKIDSVRLVYNGIPPALAATVMTLAGQQHPAFS